MSERPAAGTARPRLPDVGLALVLAFATYLERGYRFGTWPQLVPLEHILRMRGELQSDWVTSHAPLHWTFDHLWAACPAAWLEPGFAIAWGAALLVFWYGFVRLGGDIGLGKGAALAAGLIGTRTAFAGIGATAMLGSQLAPGNLGDVGWLLAAREALLGRWIGSGLWSGLALLIQPRVGSLVLATCGAVTARVSGVRRAAGLGLIALLVGGVALYRAFADFGLHPGVAPAVRLEELVRMRLAHHLDYAAFPAADYATVAAWAAVLIVALALAPRAAWRKSWTVFALALAGLCVLGAVASAAGGPLPLIELHTARASNWVPLLATLASAAVLTSRRRLAGTLALLAVPAMTEAVWPPVRGLLASSGLGAVPSHALQAPVLIALMLTVSRWPAVAWSAARARRLAAWGGTLLIPLGFLASSWRWPQRHGIDPDWREIAERARRISGERDLFVTPPDLEGFRFYSHRAIVVDFDNVPPDGLAGWRERLVALTGDPGALAPDFPGTLADRARSLATAYDRAVPRSPESLRRYGAAFVVARAPAPATPAAAPPAWLEQVDANRRFVLYRVRGEALTE